MQTLGLTLHWTDWGLQLRAAQFGPCVCAGPVTLGEHPATGEAIELKQGRFGYYLQQGSDTSQSAMQKQTKAGKVKASAKTVSLK